VPAFQRVIKVARLAVLFSAVWTILCATLLAGWWVSFGDAYRISSVLQLLNPDRVYVAASSSKTELTLKQVLADWLLDLPAIALLLMVAALLVIFYRQLASIEKTKARGITPTVIE
jgi:hypothetical protein